ncbi:MFS transporter [Nocardia sp. SYP-A9097]|uniref:MFS transporter n=1 Tax=Nocardia sp. SYP-A9097 TaxID=2663237 RepID=UPI00129C07E9|nr:MFS transporter [Nocardia sp. SYP-A9097]
MRSAVPGPRAVAPEDDPPPRLPRGFLSGVLFSYFGLYLAVLTPVMVSLAFKLQHITETSERATAALGLVAGSGAVVGMVVHPVAGRLSDRTRSVFGRRRPWILGGTIIGVIGLGCLGLAGTVPLVLLSWCVAQAGFNSALVAAQAAVADQVPRNRLGRISGLAGVTTPLSILAGSLLITVLAGDVVRFLVPGLIALVLVMPLLVRLDDPRFEGDPEPYGLRQFASSFLFDPRAHPSFSWVMLSRFLVMFGYAGIGTFFPFFLADKFALDEDAVTHAVLLVNVASVACLSLSAPIGGFLSDRIGRRRPFVAVSGLVMATGLVLLAFAPALGAVIVAQGVIGLGLGAFSAVDQALSTQVLPSPEDTAKDLGLLALAGSLPQSVGPAIAPAVIAVGNATALGGYPAWYLLGAVACLVGAVSVYRVTGVR